MFDFKVKCKNPGAMQDVTPEKIYDVVDGKLIDNSKCKRPCGTDRKFKNVDELSKWSCGQFELVEESKDFTVRCTNVFPNANKENFHVGGIYHAKDGKLETDDIGFSFEIWSRRKPATFESLKSWFSGVYSFELVGESKMFTKDDLQVNDWCLIRNGTVSRVAEFGGEKHLIGYDFWNRLSDYTETLSEKLAATKFDVVKVIRPTRECELKEARYEYGKVVFDREKGIGCEPPIKEIALSEATKLLTEKFGENVKIVVDE